MISIVIPVTDIKGESNRKDLAELLDSVKDQPYDAVICCFDSCEDEFVEYFQTNYPFIHSINHNGNRLDFTRNSNVGLRFAAQNFPGHVFLVNQDCVLPSYVYMREVCGEGLSTPRSEGGMRCHHTIEFGVSYLDSIQTLEVKRSRLKDTHFPFFCPCFNTKLFDEVGFLDEAFTKLFSDDDFCLRVLLNGKFPLETTNIVIDHKGSHIDTSNPDWESRSGCYTSGDLGLGLLQYKSKWSANRVQIRMDGYTKEVDIKHEDIIKFVLDNFTWDDSMRCP